MKVGYSMYLVVYVSSAVELFSEEQLTDILKKSRENNSAVGVTGMLLYKDGNFMQLLEGAKEAVEETLGRIEHDPRHRHILKLLQQEAPERNFSEWSMGFKKLKRDSSPETPGYSDFLNLPLDSREFIETPSKSLKLLLSFRKVVG
jgi:hypothetical protein